MSFFDENLAGGESVFRNEESLSPEWIPKILPFREKQQKTIARAIQPLFQNRSGPNILVTGAPGIGKTAAVKVILRELEETSTDVEPIYINCWQKNTTFKVFVELCELLGYKFTQNKKTEDLFAIIKKMSNKKPIVFVFDEVDKCEDVDFLYSLLEDVFVRTIILISNEDEWLSEIDARVRSRLLPDALLFQPYTKSEIREILKKRTEIAFVQDSWNQDAFEHVVEHASKFQDVRIGLHVLRISGRRAEDAGSKKIMKEHAEEAIQKMAEFEVKNPETLSEEDTTIIELVKKHSGKRIGELFELFQSSGSTTSYKTFQRHIEFLSKNKFISVEKRTGGAEGTTTIVSYEKKLTEFGGA